MALIRSKNTKPELIAFEGLRDRGVRFRSHYENAPGRPDVARPRKKLAIFIDGDFWHGREIERVRQKHGSDSPWVRKLEITMTRDLVQLEQLEARGWAVLRVWASDLTRASTRKGTLDAMEAFLRSKD